MAHSPSVDASRAGLELGPADWDLLLSLTHGAVRDGLDGKPPTLPRTSELPASLRRPAGVFVTHKVHGELNGCIGAVDSDESLGRSTTVCSWRSAFADQRLPQLTRHELEDLDTEVSVLSEFTPLEAGSRHELAEDLRVGVDGLRITAGRRGALFLPSVWEQVDDPHEFVQRLFAKAGLPARRWPVTLYAETFTTVSQSRRFGDGYIR